MVVFLGMLLFFWAVLVGSYFAFERWFRTSDADKIKDRLLGKQNKKEKSRSSEPNKVALFEAEQAPKGPII